MPWPLREIATAFPFALGVLACSPASAHDARPRRWQPATMEHGVKIGAQLDELTVDCGEGGHQTAAPRDEVQLITFATPYDCSSCAPHLASLDSLSAHGALPPNDLMVLWAPGAELEREAGLVRAHTPRKVCVDRRGMYWDRQNLQHTPITMLVVRGRVTYINDRMLSTATEQAAFLADLADQTNAR